MLKHTELLGKMSAKQKISLIANIRCLADDEYVALGIPRVKFTTLDDLFAKEGDGITPYTLARTWDTALIRDVTEQIITRNCDDSNVIVVPCPKINLGAEAGLALSEDPMLAQEISLSFLEAVNSCKKIGVLPDFHLTRKEVANMDIKLDRKALNDFIFEPFKTVAKNGDAKAIIGAISKNEGAYENFNRGLIRHKERYFSSGTDMLCLCTTYDETIAALEENCIIFSGVEIAIQNAYDQYLTLLSSIEKGSASMINLEEAFAHKTAISDQMLDIATEKVLDFAFRIDGIYQALNHQETEEPIEAAIDAPSIAPEEEAMTAEEATKSAEPVEGSPTEVEDPANETVKNADPTDTVAKEGEGVTEETALPKRSEEYENLLTRAIEKSTVLLKNKGDTLPFSHDKPYAIIGDVALIKDTSDGKSFADHFTELASGNCIGVERGYDILEDRSEALMASAVALAKKSSFVFVFLKPRDSQNLSYPRTSLPANQTALVNALSACKCNVIAVMASDTNIDVSFSKSVHGLILAPIAGRLSAAALSNIVFGKSSAGGKLTTTFYTSPNKFHKKLRFYKDTGRNKVGLFVGYRFYDIQNITVNYPFGFGLKYSKIEISNAGFSSDTLSFDVTNKGRYDIDETVEIYVGMNDSKLLRPKKELKAFRTLHIKAGESEQVTVENINFKYFDISSKQSITEDGYYTIYLGTSVSHVKSAISANVRGKTLEGTTPKFSDYLQSKTNITLNDFTLEAKHNRMANYKSLRNAGLICLLVAILVALMSVSAKSPMIPLAIGAVLLLVSLGLLIGSRNLKTRVKHEEAELIKRNKEMFENADAATTEKLEDLFVKEFKFDVTDSAVTVDSSDEIYTDSSAAALNDNMSFVLAANDFKTYATESGLAVDDQLAASLIASFVSSRLIIAKTAEERSFDAFVAATAGYFGAALFTETITEAHNPEDRLLRVANEDGTLVSTAVLNALLAAEENPDTIHIIHLKNLATDKISEYLIPYIKYLSNPRSKPEISPKGADEIYVIPENVWFIAELEKGTLVESVPAYVLEYATVLPVKYTECQHAEEKSEFVSITLTDFGLLCERARAKHILNEDTWKKIDSIESFVFKHSSYKIGNKLWLRIETFVSTLLSIETELPVAIDNTLASVILPTLASKLAGKLGDTDKNLIDEVERIFGEDNVQIAHEMLVSKA